MFTFFVIGYMYMYLQLVCMCHILPITHKYMNILFVCVCVSVCVTMCVSTGNVNLEKIEDEKERKQIESIINNFGQTPTQLFTEPHPHRMTLGEIRRSLGRGYGKRASHNLFDHLDHVRTHCVDVSHSIM